MKSGVKLFINRTKTDCPLPDNVILLSFTIMLCNLSGTKPLCPSVILLIILIFPSPPTKCNFLGLTPRYWQINRKLIAPARALRGIVIFSWCSVLMMPSNCTYASLNILNKIICPPFTGCLTNNIIMNCTMGTQYAVNCYIH